MNPKESRQLLFGKKAPVVRKIQMDDMRWLYGAHKLSGGTMSQKEFSEHFSAQAESYQEVFIIDDYSKSYKTGWGPVGAVSCYFDGWRLEPNSDWFPWAKPKNILRSAVAFFLYCRYSKDIGTVYVHSPEADNEFFKAVKKYVSLYPVKPIPGGLPSGSDHLFYIRGKKKHGTI